MPTLKESATTIVVLGSFNPVIVQPSWLEVHGLVAPDEVAEAQVNVIHRQVSDFRVGDFHVQTLDERFSVSSTSAPSVDLVRDLALGILGVLPETPVRAAGLNRGVHYIYEDTDIWNALGWKIVPKENWEDLLEHPGLQSVTIRGARRGVDIAGFTQAVVGPSDKYPQNGVKIEINDHFELLPAGSMTRATELVEVVEEQWDGSVERAEGLIDHVIGLV